MGYVDYTGGQREDMQDDVYKVVINMVILANQQYYMKDVRGFHTTIDSIFLMIHSRLQDADAIEDELNHIKDALYGESDDDTPQSVRESELFDDCRAIWKKLLKQLDDEGILLRAKANLDQIVARRSS